MNKNSIIHTLFRISKLGSYAFLLSIFGSILGGLVNYGFAFILGELTRVAVVQASSLTFDFHAFIPLACFSLISLPLLLSGQMMTLVGGLNAEKTLRKIVISNTLSHDERIIKDSHTGDLMARLTSDSGVIEDFYFQGLNYRVINPLVAGTASLITIFTLNTILGFVSLGFGILTFCISSRFAPIIQTSANHAHSLVSTSTKVVSEILSNDEYIRLSNLKDHFLGVYHSENNKLKDATIKTNATSFTAESLNQVIALTTQLTYLVICALLALNHDFDFASVLLLIRLQPHVSNAFGNLSASWNYFVEVSVSARRILEVIDTPHEDSRDDKPLLTLNSHSAPSIHFNHVSFRYDDNHPLFENLSFCVNQNQTVAFIGESGSGKSTLFQLLLGFYTPESGSITLDDKELSNYSLASCRSHMIYIQQEAPLFNRSIYENIALGSALQMNQITPDMVHKAARDANIHDFIESLPNGYDTRVGENANQISGGQRQRIAIARAFMSQAPILIMDEPTSALDSESESLIQEALNKLKETKTVLIAAHRLSTIKESECIIVLEHGKIIEEGSHAQLIAKKGRYYDFAQLQTDQSIHH